MRRPATSRPKLHFSPVRRVERRGVWHPAWAEVDRRGMALHPHYTRAEAEQLARERRAEPVFHPDFGSARAAALVLPGE